MYPSDVSISRKGYCNGSFEGNSTMKYRSNLSGMDEFNANEYLYICSG